MYIREKVLFEGEIMEYQILEDENGERKTVEEGSISCKEVTTRTLGNRFACLCLMVKGASSSFPILTYENSPPASTSTSSRIVTERRCRKYLISFMILAVSLDFYFHSV